jgi:hypothetical protein
MREQSIWNGFVGQGPFEFGIKGGRIPRQNVANGILAFLVELDRVMAHKASTISCTVNLDRKALAIQFETFCLLASASHGGDFVSMGGFNLTGGRSTFPSIDIVDSFGVGETRDGFSPQGGIGKAVRAHVI